MNAPVRIALMNDYEIVVRGLERLLSGQEPLQVVEIDCQRDPVQPVDIVLYDAFAQSRSQIEELHRLGALPHVGRLVVYTWALQPEHARAALEAGASGYLAKGMSAEDLASALLRVHAGEVVVAEPIEADVPDDVRDAPAGQDWPGRDAGLSSREAETLGMITQGMTNQQIAERLFLSPNTLKRYIRTAYRKIGVQRRSQAVAWGYEHGLAPVPKSERATA